MAAKANYGTLKDPDAAVSKMEAKTDLFPATRQILTKATGRDLNKFMRGCLGVLELPQLLMYEAPILWLIDSNDDFVFALEEYIDAETLDPISIRPRNLPREITGAKRPLIRLGHPSLTSDLKAKIGGEIYLEDNKWHLSNSSGRYGYGEERKKTHLISVAKLLKKHGISLKLDYIED